MNDIAQLSVPGFHKNSKTIFLIHGFKGDADSWPTKAKNKLLDTISELNVITVDWRRDAKAPVDPFGIGYKKAAKKTQILGNQIVDIITNLDAVLYKVVNYMGSAPKCPKWVTPHLPPNCHKMPTQIEKAILWQIMSRFRTSRKQ